MLVGFNRASLQVENVNIGDFFIKFHLRTKSDGFEWALVPVYGADQDDKKHEFLSELVRMCSTESLPMFVVGDFNILRKKEDKNNDNFNPRWPFLFNAVIESLDLREIDLSGR